MIKPATHKVAQVNSFNEALREKFVEKLLRIITCKTIQVLYFSYILFFIFLSFDATIYVVSILIAAESSKSIIEAYKIPTQ